MAKMFIISKKYWQVNDKTIKGHKKVFQKYISKSVNYAKIIQTYPN